MATGATEHIDKTTADALVEEAWSMEAIIAREKKLLHANRCDRRFEKELKHGDVIHVPSRSHLSVQTKNMSSNAATVYETVTETNTDITVGTWEYQAIAIETATKKQVNRDMIQWYAPEQGYALALSVDDTLTALAASGLTAQTVGTLTQDLSYANALRAIQYLDDADAPTSDRWWAISPAQKAGFMQLPQFVHADWSKLNGKVNQAAKDAFLGYWMGDPVYYSSNVDGSNAAGHNNSYMHKECMALIIQMKPTSHTMFDLDYFAHKAAVEQLRGSAVMRADHGVLVKAA